MFVAVQLLLFAGQIASRLMRTAISLMEGILFQLIFTGVVKCNQYLQFLFAHVHLQSKYNSSFAYSSNGASIRKSTVDGRL